MNIATVLLVLLAGMAVGATSIGGVLVVPTLTTLSGMPVPEAIAVSNFSFLFTGAAAIWLQRSSTRPLTSVPRRQLASFYLAAFLGAAVGAITLGMLPVALIRSLVAAVAILSGVLALRGVRPKPASAISPVGSICVGLCVGCASAWSGTGGPVLLLPVLIIARVPILLAMPMAQGIQLPIAGAATVVNIWSSRLDLGFGVMLGALVLIGWWAGLTISRRIAPRMLQRVIATGLIAVGVMYGWQTLHIAAL